MFYFGTFVFPMTRLLVKLDGKTDREVVGNLRKHDIVSYTTYSHIHKLQTRSHRIRNRRMPNTVDLISFPCFCTPQQLLPTAASSRNRAIRHGWKSNNIVRKVDGNQTNLDWIQTKTQKAAVFKLPYFAHDACFVSLRAWEFVKWYKLWY